MTNPPSFKTTSRANSIESTREKTAEGTRKRCSSVKDTNPQGELSALVEMRKVEDHARQKSTFCYTQQRTHSGER